jgi:hypothetical protein
MARPHLRERMHFIQPKLRLRFTFQGAHHKRRTPVAQRNLPVEQRPPGNERPLTPASRWGKCAAKKTTQGEAAARFRPGGFVLILIDAIIKPQCAVRIEPNRPGRNVTASR